MKRTRYASIREQITVITLVETESGSLNRTALAYVDDETSSSLGGLELLWIEAESLMTGSAEGDLDSSEAGCPLLSGQSEHPLCLFRRRNRIGSNIFEHFRMRTEETSALYTPQDSPTSFVGDDLLKEGRKIEL